MTSPLVLDPVIHSLSDAGGISIENARAKLASQIKVAFGKDTLLRLDVTAGQPEEAQKIANLIIDAYLKSTAPGELDRADLEKDLSTPRPRWKRFENRLSASPPMGPAS